uniref:Putative ubiquitin specific protease 2 n=1 Tax=Anopheles marajoara TaxID=58244 RepID=A0A2M4BW63_9DIPT
MPVISAYSSSGSSYITSSRYPKSSYSDRKYYPSLSSGGFSSYSSGGSGSSSSSTYGSGSGGLHYRKSSYRYDLTPTASSSACLSRVAEDRSDTGSTYRVPSQPAATTTSSSHQQEAATTLCNGAATGNEDSASNSTSVINNNNNNSSTTNSSSSRSNIGTSLSRSNRYSSTYGGGYGSSSLNRDYSYTRGGTTSGTSGSSNSPGGSNYVSNLRNSALCGAELYQRYSLSTFKPAPSIVSRATSGSGSGIGSSTTTTTNTTSSTLAFLRGSSPIASSLEGVVSGSKSALLLTEATVPLIPCCA